MITKNSAYNRIDEVMQENLEHIDNKIKIVQAHESMIVNSVNEDIQNDSVLLDIFQTILLNPKMEDALRLKLFEHFQAQYQILEKTGVAQMHFVTADTRSFLRMHKPDLFGDDLAESRNLYSMVKKTHQSITGFEMGRSTHARRYVYPILDTKGNYLGAFEISFYIEYTAKLIDQITGNDSHILVHKTMAMSKLWDEKQNWSMDYRSSRENSSDYFESFLLKKDPSTPKDQANSEVFRNFTETYGNIIQNKLHGNTKFQFFGTVKDKIISAYFIPCHDSHKKNTLAWFVSYKYSNPIIEKILFNLHIVQIVSAFILLLLQYFISKAYLSKMKLNSQNQNLASLIQKRTMEIEEANKHYESMVENIGDKFIIFKYEEDKKISYVSKGIQNVFGLDMNDAIGRSWDELIQWDSDSKDKIIELFHEMTSGKNHFVQTELSFIHPDGNQHFVKISCHGVSGNSSDSHVFQGIIEDVSHEKRIEQKLIESIQDAERANKVLEREKKRTEVSLKQVDAQQRQLLTLNDELLLEKERAEDAVRTKSAFLANMSHEIRTPMNAILGLTALALEDDMNEKQRNYISKAHKAAENLLGIINDILDFSKIEAGKLLLSPVHFAIKSMIDQVVQLISVSAKEKGVRIRVKLDHNIPKVFFADSLRIAQVLINLGNNAVKFSHKGGSVTLEIEAIEKNENDALIYFAITDEGIGISQENQIKLFESFSQVDASMTRKFGGTGLGLAISQNIIQLMGGKISVESEEGKGSKFSFAISMKISDEDFILNSSDESNAKLNTALKNLKNAKILLVEDNELNQELAYDLLTKNGLFVTIANNGKEALECLEKEVFDAVLMDCQMPVMDGYEASEKIRMQEKFKNLPIISMSANVMSGDRNRALESGMNDTIEKPIIPETMFSTMAKWIKK